MSKPEPRAECWHVIYTAHSQTKYGKALPTQRSPVRPPCLSTLCKTWKEKRSPLFHPPGYRVRARRSQISEHSKAWGWLCVGTWGNKSQRSQGPMARQRRQEPKKRSRPESSAEGGHSPTGTRASSQCLDAPWKAQDPCHWHLPAFVRATEPHPCPSQAHKAHALDSL